MSKVNSNNYQQAVKEITAMDADQVSRIPEAINAVDSKHYHVALVRITDRPGQPKNDVNVNVQQYHRNGFEKIQKSFIFQGFAKLVVVHDPTKPVEVVKERTKETKVAETTTAGTDDTGKDENAGKTPENDPDELDLEQQFQFAITGNKPELIHFAEKHGIDLSEATNNDLRVEVITKWFNEKMESNSNE